MHGIETIQALNAKAVREAAAQPGAKTVKLELGAEAHDAGTNYQWFVMNVANGRAVYASAYGGTPEQAKLRAQQIVDFCDGAIAE
jgi:hypothetical protein